MRLLISRHLENFLALFDARNMHAAAERKGISQPALTKSLKLLEEDLKAELFLRTPRGLEPTSAGETLYRYARAIDQEARFATMDVGAIHENLGGRIRIGVGQVLAVSAFPAVLAKFHRRFPAVEVSVETGVSTQLVEELVREGFDVVVTALPETPLPERFAAVSLFTTDMVVICGKDHPLHDRRTVARGDLTAFRRVGFVDDREFEKKSRRVFGARADRLRPVLQTTSLTIMFGILATTDYYAIVSDMIVPRALREGLVQLPLDEPLWRLDIDLMCKVSLMSSRPVNVLREALLDYSTE